MSYIKNDPNYLKKLANVLYHLPDKEIERLVQVVVNRGGANYLKNMLQTYIGNEKLKTFINRTQNSR